MPDFNISLLPNQKEIFYDDHRFRVMCCGRRFGKSELASYIVITAALKNPNTNYFLISPTYAMTNILWRMCKAKIPPEMGCKIMEGDRVIKFPNGSCIYSKSGDNPLSLKGEKLKGAVLDEAAQLSPSVWSEAIRPALADSKGWAVMISTPLGRNWFYDLFMRGLDQDPSNDYRSFHYTSYDNPLIDKSELDEMIKQMPDMVYRQEILAAFLDSGGMVFKNFEQLMGDTYESFRDGEIYVMGVDLGRHDDFTWISIGKSSDRRIVYMERFNNSDWEYIKDRIRIASDSYGKPTCYLDSTGVGDPIAEDLIKDGVNVSPYHMNSATKPALINNLAVTIENKQILLPNDEELRKELGAYAYKRTENGHITYNAPEGMHDDGVISIALTVYGLGTNATTIGLIDDFKASDEPKEGEFDYDDIPDVLEGYEDEEFWGEKSYNVKRRISL